MASGMKDILHTYQKQYAKRLKQTPEERQAEGIIWVDMAAQVRKGAIEYRNQLLVQHNQQETEWLKANTGKGRDSAEFKAVANRNIKERNAFTVPYGIEGEDLLK